ncbi:hypothetical protein FHN55_12255 [Streptomyces sp. NP160]|uniref:hypothetical protein n=1 Tax=Streptomyces sp. NP160 TaxID=2586637 RepID=UPI001117ED3A|nr:hypothetical protein [Streptomyces sp. NP160]TNM66869.1 hypothetical protein FHN55_12255 [Streptomyces sp. NP160]
MAKKGRGEKKPPRTAPPGGWPTGKQAAAASPPPFGQKIPSSVEPDREEVMNRKLGWRLGQVDLDGPWGFLKMAPTELRAVLDRLSSFETMTVREVFYTGEEPGKHYSVDDLVKEARDRLTELDLDDETLIARLRIDGPGRVYGFLRESDFWFLWWDPRHEIYPTSR